MSLQESDREDLLREATALVERMELQPDGDDRPWIVGFRRNGAVSLFVDVDPVFQLNTQFEIRRAYVGGRLVKAEGGKLYWLDRRRTETETQLVRSALSAEETADLLTSARRHFDTLNQCLSRDGGASFVGAVPDQATVVRRTLTWLNEAPENFVVAASPRVG